MTARTSLSPWLGAVGALWGAAGFAAILLDAINRLSAMALRALGQELTPVHLLVLVLVVAAMAYMEGYRGFQKSFSPRCAARLHWLYKNPEPLPVLLAPLFCMGFFRAERAPLMFAWIGTFLIVLLIVALQFAPQPWRGIVDAGVVVGLTWGLVSFLIALWQAFREEKIVMSPAIPGDVV